MQLVFSQKRGRNPFQPRRRTKRLGSASQAGYGVPLVNAATFMLTFTDKEKRKRDIWQVMDGLVAEAKATIPGIRRFQIKEMGSDVMASAQAVRRSTPGGVLA